MKYEPILNVHIKDFCETFGLGKLNEDQIFERFVNNLIITMYQPEATTKNTSLLEMSSVGGKDDMGIDGIGIKVNNIFVTSKKEIDNIIAQNGKITSEIVFIQSKNKDKIDSGEFSKFADGIYAFLSECCYEPYNEKIAELLEIKEYLFSDAVMMAWKEAPVIKCFYVIFGDWRYDEHIEGKITSLKAKIDQLNNYSDCSIRCYGTQELVQIFNDNNNQIQVTLNVLGSIEFEEVPEITNSQVILCKASEFLKLLKTEEGIIRKSLFCDNVRDYQGQTAINQGMLDTIEKSPSSFLLLNNGITIVCSELHSSNRKVTLTNPQIVNGCQTSNVLFYSSSQNQNLDNVYVLVKIIATSKDDITNAIVQGTNSQNPVFIESFEITKEFHKDLEEFVVAYQSNIKNPEDKIYYERRSKQYEGNPMVKKSRTFNLDLLSHYVISIFLHSPHDSVLHIVNILKRYGNGIYVQSQSKLPYFTAAYMGLNFEKMIEEGLIDRYYDTYKYFIIAMTAEKIVGRPLDINSRSVDDDCGKIIDTIRADRYHEFILKMKDEFDKIRKQWISQFGVKYKHGIKDNPAFTQYLFTAFRGGKVDNFDLKIDETSVEQRGIVLNARKDRAGRYYGFIQAYPENVFFHEEDNPRIDFSRIEGKTVLYYTTTNEINGKIKAKNVRVV